jgi:hypothetical protein
MRLLEDIVLTESIAIRAMPEKVFRFFLNIVDDATYRARYPEDHVALRWIKGEPWEEGSVVYAEQCLHGRRHKLKLLIMKVVPTRRIEFAALSRILRVYFPKNTISTEPKENSGVFTATGCVRVGWLLKNFAGKKLRYGLSCAKKQRI